MEHLLLCQRVMNMNVSYSSYKLYYSTRKIVIETGTDADNENNSDGISFPITLIRLKANY